MCDNIGTTLGNSLTDRDAGVSEIRQTSNTCLQIPMTRSSHQQQVQENGHNNVDQCFGQHMNVTPCTLNNSLNFEGHAIQELPELVQRQARNNQPPQQYCWGDPGTYIQTMNGPQIATQRHQPTDSCYRYPQQVSGQREGYMCSSGSYVSPFPQQLAGSFGIGPPSGSSMNQHLINILPQSQPQRNEYHTEHVQHSYQPYLQPQVNNRGFPYHYRPLPLPTTFRPIRHIPPWHPTNQVCVDPFQRQSVSELNSLYQHNLHWQNNGSFLGPPTTEASAGLRPEYFGSHQYVSHCQRQQMNRMPQQHQNIGSSYADPFLDQGMARLNIEPQMQQNAYYQSPQNIENQTSDGTNGNTQLQYQNIWGNQGPFLGPTYQPTPNASPWTQYTRDQQQTTLFCSQQLSGINNVPQSQQHIYCQNQYSFRGEPNYLPNTGLVSNQTSRQPNLTTYQRQHRYETNNSSQQNPIMDCRNVDPTPGSLVRVPNHFNHDLHETFPRLQQRPFPRRPMNGPDSNHTLPRTLQDADDNTTSVSGQPNDEPLATNTAETILDLGSSNHYNDGDKSESQRLEEVTRPANEEENQQKGEIKAMERCLHVIENEFKCSICHEIVIKAVVLSCSHTLCSLCFKQWVKINAKSLDCAACKRETKCPHCRSTVGRPYRSVAIDNLVEQFVEEMPDNQRRERTGVVGERNDAEEQFDKQYGDTVMFTNNSTAADSVNADVVSHNHSTTEEDDLLTDSDDEILITRNGTFARAERVHVLNRMQLFRRSLRRPFLAGAVTPPPTASLDDILRPLRRFNELLNPLLLPSIASVLDRDDTESNNESESERSLTSPSSESDTDDSSETNDDTSAMNSYISDSQQETAHVESSSESNEHIRALISDPSESPTGVDGSELDHENRSDISVFNSATGMSSFVQDGHAEIQGDNDSSSQDNYFSAHGENSNSEGEKSK